MLLTRHKLLLLGLGWCALALLILGGLVAYAGLAAAPLPSVPPTVAALAYVPAPTGEQPPPANGLAADGGASPATTPTASQATVTSSPPAAPDSTEALTETPPPDGDAPTQAETTTTPAASDTPVEPATSAPTDTEPAATPTASLTPMPTPTAGPPTNTTTPIPTHIPTNVPTSTATTGPTNTPTTAPTSTATSAPTSAPPPGPVPVADFWGVNGGPIEGNNSTTSFDGDLSRNPTLRAKSFYWLNQAGVRWYRNYGSDSIDLSWRFVEPQPGVYDWTTWDNLVREAQKKDVNLLASIGNGVPSWANGSNDWRVKPLDLFTEPLQTTAWY